MADATPCREYESYGASLYVLNVQSCESEGPSLPFGFVRHRELTADRVELPEPWMWWR